MRHYGDISHFRAPYKNMSIGALPTGNPSAALEDEYAKYATMFDKKDGLNYWTADAKKFAMQALEQSHFQPVPGDDDRVGIIGLTAEEQAALAANPGTSIAFKASDWVKQKLREGKAIIAPVWLLTPVAGPGREIAAVPTKDVSRLRAAASTPIAGILVAPTSAADILKYGLIAGGIILGAVVIGGIITKGRYKANRGKKSSRAYRLGYADAARARPWGHTRALREAGIANNVTNRRDFARGFQVACQVGGSR